MIFQKTLEAVLSGRKSQTSRLWKPDYVFSWSEYEEPNQVVLSQKAWDKHQIRKLYYVGQELAVQPARGQKGVARIRILELAKRDVRRFDYEDMKREGFGDSDSPFTWFFNVWADMHDKSAISIARHRDISIISAIDARPAQFYTALVIRFELVNEAIPA